MFPVFLIQVLVVLIIVGLILWAISQFPLDPTISRLIRVVLIVMVCLWLISMLLGHSGGALGGYRSMLSENIPILA